MTQDLNEPVRRARRASTDALNHPVQSSGPELDSRDFPVGQMPDIDMDLSKDIDRERLVEIVDKPLQNAMLAALAFAEEPVSIIIGKGSERNAPMVVPCWSQGKGAELLINGKWCEATWLPVNMNITTKRKYVESLLRSKITDYQTYHGNPGEADRNTQTSNTSSVNPITVTRDDNPLAAEWLSRILGERE